MEWRAFSNCDNLKSIRVHDENSTFDSRANCNVVIQTKHDCLVIGCAISKITDGVKNGESTFWHCHSLTNITIPDSVVEIDDWAFCGCISLKELQIPSFVTRIGERAFRCCASLTEISVPNLVKHIDRGTFFVVTNYLNFQ